MLIFVPIILVTGLTASFAAQYYENHSCTDKCMETTASYGTVERYLKCLSTCMSSSKDNHLKKRSFDDSERTKTKIEEKLEIKKEESLGKLPTDNMKLREKLPKNFRKSKAIDRLLGSRKSQLNEADLKKKAELNVSNIVEGIKHKIHESINHLIDIPLMVAQGLIQNGHNKIAADDDKRNLSKEVSSLNVNLAPKSKPKDSDMATVSAKVKREVPDQYGYNDMEASNQNRPVILRFPAARPSGTTRRRLNLVATPGQRARSATYVERLIGNNVYFQRRTAAGDNTRAGAQEKARSNGAFQDGDGTGNNQADNAAGLNAGDQRGVANTGAGTADIANRIQGPANLRKETGNWDRPGSDYSRLAERANGLRIAYKSLTNGATERNSNVAVVPRNNVYRNDARQAITEGHAIFNDENPRNPNPSLTNSKQYVATERNTYGAVVPRNNVYRNDGGQAITEGHAIFNDENSRNLNPAFTNSNQYRYTQK